MVFRPKVGIFVKVWVVSAIVPFTPHPLPPTPGIVALAPYFATMHASMNLCPRRISNLALISTTRCNKLRFKSKTLGGRSSKTSSTRCENAKKGKSINKQKKMALNAQHVRFTRFFSSAIFTEKRTSLWASVHPGNAAIKDKPEYFCEVIFSGNVLADVNVAFAYLSNLMLYQSKLI